MLDFSAPNKINKILVLEGFGDNVKQSTSEIRESDVDAEKI